MRWGLVTVLVFCAGTAVAKPGTPGPHYFQGTFERIGRSGGPSPSLLNDRVRIEPMGQQVAITGCGEPETIMGFGPAIEIEYLMLGRQGRSAVECLFHNNGYNRPILTCRAEDGAAYTLWPLDGEARDAALTCPG